MTQPEPTAAIEVWARMLCSADVHVYGADHPTWQQLVGEPGRKIRDDYRKAAAWLLPRLTVADAPVGPAPATDREALRQRIAAALAREDAHNAGYDHGFVGQYGLDDETDGFVDAVLAVLSAADQRAAVLLAGEAQQDEPTDEDVVEAHRLALSFALDGTETVAREAQQEPTQDAEALKPYLTPSGNVRVDHLLRRSGQPETDLVEQLARGLAGAAAANPRRTAAPWDDLTADQQDAYRQQARTILSVTETEEGTA